MDPITLSPQELAQVLNRVTVTKREYGATRICRHLATKPSSRTREINIECAVGNIRDIVTKMINPRIASMGLMVASTKPLRAFTNKYGQSTGEHLWSFYRDVAANDDNYDLDFHHSYDTTQRGGE
jgi:hypothetical protein